MKRTIKYIVLSTVLAAGVCACETDNYEGPKETFRGQFTDKGTGENFQTAVGGTGIRIRMMEYSWSDDPQPYDMYVMQDGAFNNTKIFKGEYGIKPEGAFVPLEEERVNIKGTVTKDYQVEPLLRVEWVGRPTVNADGTVDAQVKVSRGTDNPAYQQALAEVWLFVSETDYVGFHSYSNYYSTKLTAAQAGALGETITIKTGQPSGPGSTQNIFPKYERQYFLRAAARINLAILGSNSVYNYSTIVEITNPARQ
jgi:hypothetical protein